MVLSATIPRLFGSAMQRLGWQGVSASQGEQIPASCSGTAFEPARATAAAEGKGTRPTASGLLKTWLQSWKSREINPVLLKELRQAMRSRALAVSVTGMTAMQFLAVSFFIVRREFLVRGDKALGMPVFEALITILTVVTLFLLPLYVGARLAVERRESDLDLMFITALPPQKIVSGKLLAGAFVTILLFSVSAPFMTLANLMRGMDLLNVSLILFCLFWAVCVAMQIAMLLASLPFPFFVRVVIGLLFAAGLAAATRGLLVFFSGLIRSGIDVTRMSFWFGLFFLLLVTMAVTGMFFLMTVSFVINDRRPRGYYNELIQRPEERLPAAAEKTD